MKGTLISPDQIPDVAESSILSPWKRGSISRGAGIFFLESFPKEKAPWVEAQGAREVNAFSDYGNGGQAVESGGQVRSVDSASVPQSG